MISFDVVLVKTVGLNFVLGYNTMSLWDCDPLYPLNLDGLCAVGKVTAEPTECSATYWVFTVQSFEQKFVNSSVKYI